ncbi:MAG TPA: amidohydrolase, partial [Gammaproteobacteria bacterium]|nr:amidohydrolase [Gammaproteobacteria bacterium]
MTLTPHSKRSTPWLGCAAALSLVAAASSAQSPAADLALTNGKIITVDEQFRIAEAVAVRGGWIVAVGTSAE